MSTLPPLTYLTPASEEAWTTFSLQGAIAPGTTGWWKLWGASVRDIRTGDLVLVKAGEAQEVILVDGTFTAKAAPLRLGFRAGGEEFTLGALNPVVVLRHGTGHKLADSVR